MGYGGMITGDGNYVQTAVVHEATWRGVQRPWNKDVFQRIHE
jgi:hypothetical protein